MSTNDSLIGQLVLLMLPGSRMQIVDDMECIVIPKDANPAIFMTQTPSGQRKALWDIFVKATQNSRLVIRVLLEQMTMTCLKVDYEIMAID